MRNKSSSNTKSQTTLNTHSKNKSDHMERLLKEQITCMKKMLILVQDDKDKTTNSSISVKKHIYLK